MVFILDTAIGVGVWVPFTVGKSAALLSVSIRDGYLACGGITKKGYIVGSPTNFATFALAHPRDPDNNGPDCRLCCIPTCRDSIPACIPGHRQAGPLGILNWSSLRRALARKECTRESIGHGDRGGVYSI